MFKSYLLKIETIIKLQKKPTFRMASSTCAVQSLVLHCFMMGLILHILVHNNASALDFTGKVKIQATLNKSC